MQLKDKKGNYIMVVGSRHVGKKYLKEALNNGTLTNASPYFDNVKALSSRMLAEYYIAKLHNEWEEIRTGLPFYTRYSLQRHALSLYMCSICFKLKCKHVKYVPQRHYTSYIKREDSKFFENIIII